MEGAGFFERHTAVRALRHRDFRLLLAGTSLVGLVMPMQFITQTFWVQDAFPERQTLYVALLAGVRGVATLLFSLLGGAIADRFERRRILLGCESASFVLNALVALLMLTTPFGEATIAGLAVLTFLAAGNMAIDMPTRTASIPAITGMGDLANAISLNATANQLAIPLTIPIAGLLNGIFDPGAVYAGSLVAWAGILPLIAALSYRSRGEGRGQNMLGAIRAGLRYVRADRVIYPVMAIFFVMQVIGMTGPANLGVVWITDDLHASRAGFAAMALTWGFGAVAGSLVFAQRPQLAGRPRSLCFTGILFGVAAIVFGHSRLLPLTGVANFAIGFSIAATSVCASTIVQHAVAEGMRGRVMALFPLANGLAMVNTAPMGALGQGIGLGIVMPAIGWTTLLLTLAVIAMSPTLRESAPAHEQPPDDAAPVPVLAETAAEP